MSTPRKGTQGKPITVARDGKPVMASKAIQGQTVSTSIGQGPTTSKGQYMIVGPRSNSPMGKTPTSQPVAATAMTISMPKSNTALDRNRELASMLQTVDIDPDVLDMAMRNVEQARVEIENNPAID